MWAQMFHVYLSLSFLLLFLLPHCCLVLLCDSVFVAVLCAVGSELREIQKHVDALSEPTDPNMVQELLWLRRDVLFLEFDTAVRHCMTDTFISTGNMQAFRVGMGVEGWEWGCVFVCVCLRRGV